METLREAEKRHIRDAEGDPVLALRNILCHIEFMLTADEKEVINWHDEQSAGIAVLRIISDWQDAKRPLTPSDVHVGDWVLWGAPNALGSRVDVVAGISAERVRLEPEGWIPRAWIKEVRR